MASKVGRVIQDLNLNVRSDGAFKSKQKRGLGGGRKPLGDVSNTGKLQFTKASKKPAQLVIPEINSAARKKGLSKTSGKVQINSSRKALADVSNTVKPLQKTCSVVAKESCCDFENVGFLHDHNKCIEAMSEGQMDQMEIMRMIHGPPNPSYKLSSPSKDVQLTKLEEESLTIYLDEVLENDSSLLHIKYESSLSSPRSSTPLSPDPYTDLPRIWEDCDFQVIGSP